MTKEQQKQYDKLYKEYIKSRDALWSFRDEITNKTSKMNGSVILKTAQSKIKNLIRILNDD